MIDCTLLVIVVRSGDLITRWNSQKIVHVPGKCHEKGFLDINILSNKSEGTILTCLEFFL